MNKKKFARFVFTDEKLKRFLTKEDYEEFLKLKLSLGSMSPVLADKIAEAMKAWALSLGATHFAHWFFPLTLNSAEKQVAFLDRNGSGKTIESFDGSQLIMGEADASSFPSGSERMTFEARGYMVWDYTSPVFVKCDYDGNKVLYIPSAFCSYSGVALDEKTPLLRATEILNRELTKFLHIMGMTDVKGVTCNLGIEQEYFLVSKKLYAKRRDLVFAGRTLVSAPAIKNQYVCHHYFLNISSKINKFLKELDSTLWQLGILAKTQHNEVAPHQFEIVPLFASANISTDQNVLLMEVMDKVADRHGLKVLFHEKPFAGINGSGKHNNLSLMTDSGMNLLDRKQTPPEIFLAIFTSILSAVNKHADLLRASTASLSNDMRLGESEAPPPVISVYVGSFMLDMLVNFLNTKTISLAGRKVLDTHANCLAKLCKDDADRNRTSPFAFTGNKFEFRMVGSSQNTAFCSTVFCTIVASEFAEINKVLSASKNLKADLNCIIEQNIRQSLRIIFNGNNYDNSWLEEAKQRGLFALNGTIDCLDRLLKRENIELFERLGVMSEAELKVRYESGLKDYSENILVEAKALIFMMQRQALPAIFEYEKLLLNLQSSELQLGIGNRTKNMLVVKLDNASNEIAEKLETLSGKIKELTEVSSPHDSAVFAEGQILPLLKQVRALFDAVEEMLPEHLKPFPDYNDLLFDDFV